MSLEQCHLPCAVEFEWCRENRFVVRGFIPRYTGDIAWEGDVDVVLYSEHEECLTVIFVCVSGCFVLLNDSGSVSI